MTRTAMLEWAAVAVLLVGCALITTGVIVMVFDSSLAFVFIIVGAVLALLGGVFWTVVIKAATRRSRTA